MIDIHYPTVEIKTPRPRHGVTPNVLTTVRVDGVVWPVTDYRVEGKGVDDVQTITLTFLADVTVIHPDDAL